jgi:hypothetical protein
LMPIPKVHLVTQLLKRFPTELEADLLEFYHLDILDWHRGDLSSRRLLVLAEKLSERGDSEIRKALSPTGWTETVEMISHIRDDVAMLRAAKFYGTEHGTYSKLLAPKDREKYVADQLRDAEETRELLDGLF